MSSVAAGVIPTVYGVAAAIPGLTIAAVGVKIVNPYMVAYGTALAAPNMMIATHGALQIVDGFTEAGSAVFDAPNPLKGTLVDKLHFGLDHFPH